MEAVFGWIGSNIGLCGFIVFLCVAVYFLFVTFAARFCAGIAAQKRAEELGFKEYLAIRSRKVFFSRKVS